jgi:hypothetical protein
VAGGTAGAAARLASSAYVPTEGRSTSRTGAQASCAASGAATADARGRPSRGDHTRTQAPPRTTIAAVATTERAKPTWNASHGSVSSSAVTVVARAAGARAGRPDRRPSRPTTPVTAARSTLGCGPTSRSRAAPVSRTTPARSATGSRHAAAAAAAIAPMSAKWDPETAMRWVSPAVRIASDRSSGTRELSPSAMPRSRTPASAGSRDAIRRVAARTRSAARSGHPGGATTSAADLAASVATVLSVTSDRVSRPVTRTMLPGGTSPGATTTTEAAAPDRRPRLSTQRTETVYRRSGSPSLHRASIGTGRSTTRPVTVAVAPSRRAVPSRPPVRSPRCADASSSASASTRTASATVAETRCPGRRGRRHRVATTRTGTSTTAAVPIHRTAVGPPATPSAAPAQHPTATGSRRRSSAWGASGVPTSDGPS